MVSAVPGAASLSPRNLEGTLQPRCARDDTSKRRPPSWGAVGCWARESARRPSASRWGQGRTRVLTQQERQEGWQLGCGRQMVPEGAQSSNLRPGQPPGRPRPLQRAEARTGRGREGAPPVRSALALRADASLALRSLSSLGRLPLAAPLSLSFPPASPPSAPLPAAPPSQQTRLSVSQEVLSQSRLGGELAWGAPACYTLRAGWDPRGHIPGLTLVQVLERSWRSGGSQFRHPWPWGAGFLHTQPVSVHRAAVHRAGQGTPRGEPEPLG